MKTKFPVSERYQVTSLSLAAAIAVTSQASGAVISSQFESVAGLDDYSQRTNFGGLSTGGFQFTAANGRDGTGGLTRVVPTTETTAINTAAVFNLNSQPTTTTLIISQFFFVPTASGTVGNVLQLGLTANNDSGFYSDTGHSFITGRLARQTTSSLTLGFETQTRSGNVTPNASVGSALTVAIDTWYKFSVSLAKTATANTFSHSMTVENWGTSGAAFVSTLATSTAGTFTNNELYTDTPAYAGFRSGSDSGITRFDSFEVVPEPSGFMLLGCSAIGLLVRRRR